ncbi:MAG: hypothetical protein CSA03_02475 [Bacteroidetes bacterium]|nr:MAG: hypothetical protein CSA03_02475 [Bacteroidota bacterium]
MTLSQPLFILLLATTFSFGTFSQSDDTNCVGKRWILVENTELNALLFSDMNNLVQELARQLDEQQLTINDEELDVVPIPNRKGKSTIVTTDHGMSVLFPEPNTIYAHKYGSLENPDGSTMMRNLPDGTQQFYHPKPISVNHESDIPLVDDDGDLLTITNPDGSEVGVYTDLMSFSIQSDIPLKNEDGTYKITTLEDGTEAFLFENPKEYSVYTRSINGMIITEERLYNEETNEYFGEFRAVSIQFDIKLGKYLKRLKIDLDDFYKNIESPEKQEWYNFLKGRYYTGKTTMKMPCSKN